MHIGEGVSFPASELTCKNRQMSLASSSFFALCSLSLIVEPAISLFFGGQNSFQREMFFFSFACSLVRVFSVLP